MQILSGKQIYVAWPHELGLLGVCSKDRQHTKVCVRLIKFDVSGFFFSSVIE